MCAQAKTDSGTWRNFSDITLARGNPATLIRGFFPGADAVTRKTKEIVMSFWILAIPLAALVAVSLALASRRGGAVANDQNRDIGVYRQQLAEVDRDLQRGVLSAEDGERLRLEVSRRLLDADRAASDAGAPAPTRPGFIPGATSRLRFLAGRFGFTHNLAHRIILTSP